MEERVSVCVGGIPEGSIRSTGMKQEKQVEIQNAAVQVVTRLVITWTIVSGCMRGAAHLLLAVKVAARAMPGSFFFRLVGESMLPVLRALECEGKTLGWSSLNKADGHLVIIMTVIVYFRITFRVREYKVKKLKD